MQLSRGSPESVALAIIAGRQGKQRHSKTELPVALRADFRQQASVDI